jgi:hypothetical protein
MTYVIKKTKGGTKKEEKRKKNVKKAMKKICFDRLNKLNKEPPIKKPKKIRLFTFDE